MSKIVIDARESGRSTGRYVDRMIEHMHDCRPPHDIVILTRPDRLKYMAQIAPGFTTYETNYKEFTFSEQIGFRKQLESLSPDLVHFPAAQQPAWYKGKVVTTIQDLTTVRFRNPSKNIVVYNVKRLVYIWLNKRVGHKSVELITPTEFVRQDFADFAHIDPDKITATYESADVFPDAPTPLPDLQSKDFIMYVGRPMPHKNLGRLIDAFQLLQRDHPSLHLVLAGKSDANYQRHMDYVHDHGVQNVIFTDFVTDGQLRWLYENCQAYVFPSLSEGFGLPGLEAMAHGAPVVSSNATCLPELYEDAALYFDPYSVNDIAGKLRQVLSDQELQRRLVAKGLKQAAKFSWRRMAEQTLGVYEKALGD